MATEQQALAEALQSQATGGATLTSGALGAGADVPSVLAASPATEQLLQEQIATRTGGGVDIDARIAEMQAQAERFATDSAASTSQGIQQQEDAAASKLDELISTNPLLGDTGIATPEFETPTEDPATALFEEAQTRADTELEQLMESIKTSFASKTAQQEALNQALLGGTRASVARGGAFGFQSGQGAITSQALAGQQRLNDLAAAEASALQAAQTAKADGDFERMFMQIERADSLRNERNELAQQEFQNTITALQEDRAAAADARSVASDQFDIFTSLDADAFAQLDPADLFAVEESLGLPTGFATLVAESNQATTERAEATTLFNTLLDSGQFNALTDEQMSSLADQVGVPLEALQGLAQQERLPNTKTVTIGNSLVEVSTDPKTGETTTSILMQVPSSTGRAGSTERDWTSVDMDQLIELQITDPAAYEQLIEINSNRWGVEEQMLFIQAQNDYWLGFEDEVDDVVTNNNVTDLNLLLPGEIGGSFRLPTDIGRITNTGGIEAFSDVAPIELDF